MPPTSFVPSLAGALSLANDPRHHIQASHTGVFDGLEEATPGHPVSVEAVTAPGKGHSKMMSPPVSGDIRQDADVE
jgi:hypothetical protein